MKSTTGHEDSAGRRELADIIFHLFYDCSARKYRLATSGGYITYSTGANREVAQLWTAKFFIEHQNIKNPRTVKPQGF